MEGEKRKMENISLEDKQQLCNQIAKHKPKPQQEIFHLAVWTFSVANGTGHVDFADFSSHCKPKHLLILQK